MNCTRIVFKDLPTEVINRLNGREAVLDLPDGFSLRRTKDVGKLSEALTVSSEGALGFSVDSTPTNDALFLEYETPMTTDNRRAYYDIEVLEAGHALSFTRLSVKGKSGRTGKWDVEISTGNEHWIDRAGKLKLYQIPFRYFNFGELDVVDNWDFPAYDGDWTESSVSTYWPPIDYGGWVDETDTGETATAKGKKIAVHDIRPLVSLPYILKRGFCEIGYSIEGVIFDAEWLRRIWVYALKDDYYEASKGGKIKGRTNDDIPVQGAGSQFVVFTEHITNVGGDSMARSISIGGTGYNCGLKNLANIKLTYRFTLKATLHNPHGFGLWVNFVVNEVDESDNTAATGETISASENMVTVRLEAGETKYVNVEIDASMGPQQKGCIAATSVSGNIMIKKGVYFEAYPNAKCLAPYGGDVYVNEMLNHEDTLLDYFKLFMFLINGRVETDEATKTINIFPKRTSRISGGDTVPGFVEDESPGVDISGLIDPDSFRIKRIKSTLKRYTRFEFQDASDAYVSSLNLTEPAHSRKIANGDELPNEVTSLQCPVIEPTMEEMITEKIWSANGGRSPRPILPRLWDNTDGVRSFAIGRRLLFAYGRVKQKNPDPPKWGSMAYCSFQFAYPAASDPIYEDIPYVAQLRTVKLDPEPTIDGNLVFGSEPNDLFTMFYLGITQEQRGGSEIDLLMRVTPDTYAAYNFRRYFKFPYKGRQIKALMTSIRDFAGCSEILTPVTFEVDASETECCDVPCGCQFKTCEYYADFGIFMRQATLNQIRLASFIVDGKQLVDSPISLGEIKMIDVGGRPYMINVVNVLNSVAAPYFSFDSSTREHPDKGYRYFKLKRPACIPFEIIFTHSGGDMYRYTDTEQKTKWFTGTWQPFGYGAVTHAEPIDCFIRTEY